MFFFFLSSPHAAPTCLPPHDWRFCTPTIAPSPFVFPPSSAIKRANTQISKHLVHCFRLPVRQLPPRGYTTRDLLASCFLHLYLPAYPTIVKHDDYHSQKQTKFYIFFTPRDSFHLYHQSSLPNNTPQDGCHGPSPRYRYRCDGPCRRCQPCCPGPWNHP